MTRELHVRVDADRLADIKAVTRCPDAAIARAGIAALTGMIQAGAVDDLRILVAKNVIATGPKTNA